MILSRATHSTLRTPSRPMLCIAAWLVLVWSTSVGQAQQTPEMVFEPAPGSTPGQASASASGFPQSHIFGAPNPEDSGVGGLGVLARTGHIAGETMERNQSITYFDMSPYMFVENTYLFGDGRLFLTNQGHMGGSAGLGIRQYFPRHDFILGGSAWYDRDETRPASFEQFGVSVELFSEFMDIRSNYYTGLGTTVQDLGTTVAPGSAAFSGHSISFQTQTALSTSTNMLDLMLTVPITGEVAQSMNLEATAGWYQVFTPSIDFKNINGYKLRLDADFLDRVLHVSTELTNDPFYGTNLVAAADVNYWHHLESRPRLGTSQYNRIAQWVRRNRNVITRDSIQLNAPQAAINPNTGLAYNINHVRNVPVPAPGFPNFPAPLGTGDVLTPFQFIDEAQAPNVDLIFVHADSVFDATDGRPPLVFNDGELIVGEGVNQSIPVPGGLFLPLPRATNGANRPVFQNMVGTAVTLANNNLFAGFDINDTQGTAILGSGIDSGAISQVRIDGTTGAAAHGIHFLNATGQFQMSNVDISNTEGNAFYVEGGDAAIVYDSGTITNTNGNSGFAVLVENNTGGSVNMSGTTVNEFGGDGVRVFNSGAATTLGNLNLTNNTGHAIDIDSVFGTVSFFDDITIVNPTGDGIRINNLLGGVSGLNPITINARNAIGVNLLNVSGTVSFLDDITIGTPGPGAGITDHAINFQQSTGQVAFADISIDGSNAAGINLGGPLATDANTGQFIVTGFTDITNVVGSSIQLINDSSDVTFNGISIGDRGGHGIEILNHSGTTSFGGVTTIRNENADGDAAVDIQDSTGTINFDTVNALGTLGPDPGVQILDNPGSVSFDSLNVTSTLTTAVDIERNASISIQGGTLDALGDRAITMIDNESFSVAFDSVSATASDFGILVQNNIALFDHPGSFAVLGDGQTAGSGGIITGMTAGASFSNVDTVDLEYMSFLGNTVGVETTDVNGLTLFGDQLTGNTSFALDALDTVDTLIQESTFLNNAGPNQVRIQASLLRNSTNVTSGIPGYRVVIRDNVFTDAANAANVGFGDMISISNLATANNSFLELLVDGNGRTNAGGVVGFSSNRGFGNAVIDTTWDGDVLATYQNNNIRMSALGGQVGMRLITTNSAAVNDVVYSGNVLNDGGGSLDTGLFMDFAGQTRLSIVDNFGVDANNNPVVDGFTMTGSNGLSLFDTAIDLNFQTLNNAIDISRNQITFTNTSTDSTAIVFQNISGPSTVNMDGNTINMFEDFVGPLERAIVFNNVTGLISLSSAANQNNFIQPGSVIQLTIPPGTSTGGFLINGFFVDPL